ncbi:hypothetical protein ACSFVZ_12340 [Pseudoalteromonas sp. SYSU M81236]|uniref:hypothetical protein n=1 Tax=Pseudoalteromonas sp. SYSU M81236 TaxID=3447014 RepID=UPI003F07FA36
MSELLGQIEELDIELQQVINCSEHKQAIEEYEVISSKLTPLTQELASLIIKLNVVDSLPENFNEILYEDFEREKLTSGKKNVEQMYSDWQSMDYSVRQEESFANTVDITSSINQLIEIKIKANWNAWINELTSTFSVSPELLETQKDIPGLSGIYTDYNRYLLKFDLIARSIPDNNTSIHSLIEHAEMLRGFLEQMDFNVPDSVKKLFSCLNQGYGKSFAPLNMINQEVMNWLVETGEINNFVVSRRR